MDWLRRLRETTTTLPDGLRDEIVRHGNDAVHDLLDVLGDDSLLPANSDDDSPPAHAAMLLGRIGAVVAVAPLLRMIASHRNAARVEQCARALDVMGPAAAEQLLLLLEDADEDVRRCAAEHLASSGAKDDRVFDALRKAFETDPRCATAWGAYGDPRAVPILERALAKLPPGAEYADGDDRDDDLTNTFTVLFDAYKKLRGSAPAELERRRTLARYNVLVGRWLYAARQRGGAGLTKTTRAAGDRLVEFAAPLEAVYGLTFEQAMELAYRIFESATLSPTKEDVVQQLDEMPDAEDAKKQLAPMLRLMVRRHRLLFPELARQGAKTPEEETIHEIIEELRPAIARAIASPEIAHIPSTELVLIVQIKPSTQCDILALPREQAVQLLEENAQAWGISPAAGSRVREADPGTLILVLADIVEGAVLTALLGPERVLH